jgi:hypothetical protein
MQLAWQARLENLEEDPYGDPLQPSSERIELIIYPDVIALLARHLRQRQRSPEGVTNNESRGAGVATNLSPRRSNSHQTAMITKTPDEDPQA